MSCVALNKIDMKSSNIDYGKINEQYDFYLITNHGEKYKPNARIFDDTLLSDNVLAIQYTSGPSFIVMLKKDRMNDSIISQIIENARSEKYDLTKEKLTVPFEKYGHSLIQILFNALAKSSKDGVSNLGGKLYYFSGFSRRRDQIYCVELKLANDYVINLPGKTFTKASQSFGKPEYILQENNTLKLKSKDDTGTFYISKQYNGTRHQTTFLDFTDQQTFESTKIGILSKLLNKFHSQYGNFVQLKIKEESDWEKIDVKASSSNKKEHLRTIKQTLNDKKICIVDEIKDAASQELCINIKKTIESIFSDEKIFLKNDRELNFTISIEENVSPDSLNLRLIHSKDYYENHKDEKDQYKVFKDYAVQHLTFEDFPRGKKREDNDKPEKTACIVELNEVLVKYDLIVNKAKTISLKNWATYQFNDVWKFCYCHEEDQWIEKKKYTDYHYYLMTINPAGLFEIEEIVDDPIHKETYDFYDKIFSMNNKNMEIHNRSDEKYKGLVINSDNEINIIQDTPNFMLPFIDKTERALKNGEINKKKEQLDYLFGGCLDIHYKKDNDEAEYYSVGKIGSGINSYSIERTALIRRIIPHKGSKLFFRNVLETMNVTFVRNGQLTVLPFPFKYLREWAKIKAKELLQKS